jgi:hypothetical protein
MKGTFLDIANRSLTTFAGTKLGEANQTIESYEDSLWGSSEGRTVLY